MGWLGLRVQRMHLAFGLRYHLRAFKEAPFNMLSSFPSCYLKGTTAGDLSTACACTRQLDMVPSEALMYRRVNLFPSKPPPCKLCPGAYDRIQCKVSMFPLKMLEREPIQGRYFSDLYILDCSRPYVLRCSELEALQYSLYFQDDLMSRVMHRSARREKVHGRHSA
jgi:hypothetical protein